MRAPDETTTRNRAIEYAWKVGEGTNRFDEPCEFFAVLLCSHRKAGINYIAGTHHPSEFFANLRREERGADGVRSHMLFDGVGIMREEVGRFSQKRLDAFAPRALERLGEVCAGEWHPKVAEIFGKAASPIAG